MNALNLRHWIVQLQLCEAARSSKNIDRSLSFSRSCLQALSAVLEHEAI